MSDKSRGQAASKKSAKTLKEKRTDRKAKSAATVASASAVEKAVHQKKR